MTAYDPRAEAQRVAGDLYDVRVLEPSPPAVRTDPYTDDPTARGDAPPARILVAPVSDADVTWDALCREREDLVPWCADRWLGAWRDLEPITDADAYTTTRASWHALAEHVVAGARHRVNGKIGLRWVRDGFGTPFFGDDEQVRVTGSEVVHTRGVDEQRGPITTLAAASAVTGVPIGVPGTLFEPSTDADADRARPVDGDAAARVADWFGFATSVLAQLRVDFAGRAPSLVQLWPEHFDLSIEAGDDAVGARAGYGASPGDAEHPEPYLYVSVWSPERIDGENPYWNEPFGASFPYSALLDAPDQRQAAFAFYRMAASLLQSSPGR